MTVQLRNEIQLQIPGYQINRLVGEHDGTMIYIAYDIERQRPVAIKVFDGYVMANRFTSTRLRKDVRQLSRLNHPNIITVYDAGSSADDREFVVADYYGGGTLADRLQVAMQAGQALAVALAVAEALRYSHACGFWHHNLKPSNIAFRHDGSVAISDFLTSKPVMLRDLSAVPSANYGDELEGKLQADVRSLGKLLFWMLTGYPANGENHTLPEELARFQTVVDRLTAAKPAITSDEAKEILAEIQEGEEHVLAITVPRSKPTLPEQKRRRISDFALWILAAVVGALTIAAIIPFIR